MYVKTLQYKNAIRTFSNTSDIVMTKGFIYKQSTVTLKHIYNLRKIFLNYNIEIAILFNLNRKIAFHLAFK